MKIWKNSKIVDQSEAMMSVYDSALMMGDMVFEMMRTFSRKTFKLQEHIDRLYASAKFLEIDMPYLPYELYEAHENLLIENRYEFDKHDEIRSLINVSRGILPIYKNILPLGTNIIITCFPLKWIIPDAYSYYTKGVPAIISSQRAIPAYLQEPKVKHRSRMYLKMADLEVKHANPDAWALMLDPSGFVAEGTGSNFFIVKNNKLYTPEPRNCLRGISRQYIMDLATRLKIDVYERNIELYDIVQADEAFFTNTPYGIVPVVSINGKPMGNGKVGKLTKYLMHKWSEDVKCDFVNQVKGWQNA